ncbi:MAG: MBL fold metallo-hydrolase [Anaerolineae bacterium]|nr:MBL fold metallo-hydrolase [Anaerolineae bacterium]
MSDYRTVEVIPGIVIAACPLGLVPIDSAVTLAKGWRLAVIDTGVGAFMPAAMQPALDGLNATLADVDLIINTHGHWDHVEGNAAIQAASGAPVLIHPDDMGLLDAPPDRLLSDGQTIDLGGFIFHVIHAPGHSAGMVCLYEPAQRLLLVSDAVQGRGAGDAGLPAYFHSGDQYRASLARLAALDATTLALGHEFAWDGPRRFVHRGDDVRRFFDASLHLAAATGRAARAALDDAGPEDWSALVAAFARRLGDTPGFAIDPAVGLDDLQQGTLRSEMRDLGLLFP